MAWVSEYTDATPVKKDNPPLNPGCKFGELQQVLPNLSRNQIQKLMQALKKEGKIRVDGVKSAAAWFPVSSHE